MTRFSGKTALVTGAGSGLGKAIALRFAQEGANVAVNDISEEKAEAVADEIRQQEGQAIALQADVSKSDQVADMFRKLTEHFSGLEILVNNAGIQFGPSGFAGLSEEERTKLMAGNAESFMPVVYMTDEDWMRMLTIHLYGHFYCSREALKIMEKNKYGKIINMSAGSGLGGQIFTPHYDASKAGIVAFTRALALEYATQGITVNAIAPGFIDTPMLDGMRQRGGLEMLAQRVPIGRIGTPEEIAALAAYLADDESSYMIGQVISIGGYV